MTRGYPLLNKGRRHVVLDIRSHNTLALFRDYVNHRLIDDLGLLRLELPGLRAFASLSSFLIELLLW